MNRAPVALALLAALVAIGCGILSPKNGTVMAWSEAQPDTIDGVGAVKFFATQDPPAWTYWLAEHVDNKWSRDYVVGAGGEPPGTRVEVLIWFPRDMTLLLRFIAWGDDAAPDTTYFASRATVPGGTR